MCSIVATTLWLNSYCNELLRSTYYRDYDKQWHVLMVRSQIIVERGSPPLNIIMLCAITEANCFRICTWFT